MPENRFTTLREWRDFFDRLNRNELSVHELRNAKVCSRRWGHCPAGIIADQTCPAGWKDSCGKLAADLYDYGVAFLFAVEDNRWRDAEHLFRVLEENEFEYFGS